MCQCVCLCVCLCAYMRVCLWGSLSVRTCVFVRMSLFVCMCYIIKEWFFYINHFSLIIFYHLVWLDFELFGLRVQVHSQLVQFYAHAQRIWQSPFCHNKWNGAEVWMMSCPEEMVLKIWEFWKDVSWILTVERCRWVFQISTDRDLKHHKMHRALGWGQHSKNCVSFLESPWTESRS